MFSIFQTASSGLHVYRTFLDATADNIANVNTMRPTSGAAFQARHVVAEAIPGVDPVEPGVGAGVRVARAAFGDPIGRIVYQPTSPLADANGNVRAPDVDLGDEMVNMMLAQRAYQANLSTLERAKDAYQQAISVAG